MTLAISIGMRGVFDAFDALDHVVGVEPLELLCEVGAELGKRRRSIAVGGYGKRITAVRKVEVERRCFGRSGECARERLLAG